MGKIATIRLSLVQAVVTITLILTLSVTSAESPGDTARSDPAKNKAASVPFEIRHGHVMVPATVGGTNSLSLLLDTGYGMTMLSPHFIDLFGLKRTGQITIVGIAGEEPAGVFAGPEFDFAGSNWKPRRVAAFPTERQSRSRRRDGILGSSFFRKYVVEIDSQANRLWLHDPDTYDYSGPGEILLMTFKSTTPIVESVVHLPGGATVKASFEIDTGCDGALCVGKHFVEAHQLADKDAVGGTGRSGVGGSTRVRSGHLPRLQLGSVLVERPPADFFLEGSPADPPRAGHIGWDLLRKFKVILDYRRTRLILERQTPGDP